MKRTILTIIAISLSLISFGQTRATQQDQYTFLQWYIDTKKFTNVKPELFIIDWGMFFRGDEKKMARLKVTLKERDHFYPQVISNKKITMLDTALLKNVQWKKPGQKSPPFVQVSLPVFSKDKKLLFICFEDNHAPEGSGYAYVGIEVYTKNQKGMWQLSKVQPFKTEYLVYNSAVRTIPEGQ